MSKLSNRLPKALRPGVVVVCLLLSCQPQQMRIRDFEVTRYREVASDYQYSPDIVEYDGKRFVPTLKEEYQAGVLTSTAVFKSEGRLVYSKSDLEEDRQLGKSLGVTPERQLLVGDGSVLDNGHGWRIKGKDAVDTYSCLEGKELRIYVVRE